MPRSISFPKWLLPNLRRLISVRCFFLITCISFTISICWIQFVDKEYLLEVDESLIEEAIQNIARDYRYVNVYRKPDRLPKGTKYILFWTPKDYAPFYFFNTGQRGFIEKNCSFTNCYVTDNKHFFGYGNITQFDVIAFNGRNINYMKRSYLPQIRDPSQKYIFFNMESSDNHPICNEIFDDFFNWTATYKLDSDIPFPYILVRNLDGKVMGPKEDVKWEEDVNLIEKNISLKLYKKTKAAAWFVSHCHSRSGRNELVAELQKALSQYSLTIDIYGKCGSLSCPREGKDNCKSILQRDYYFYLSFENSFSEDYVTEKLLTPLENYAVPVVFGGANYTRFLPPGSFLDAKKYSPKKLAETMATLMKSPKHYRQFFRWRNHYTYHDPSRVENVCAVCEAINDVNKMRRITRYKHFREWWHHDFKNRCAQPP